MGRFRYDQSNREGSAQRNYHSKIQTNYRLRPEAVAALHEVARRTGRSKTEVVEYAILKLASSFPDLAGEARRALLEVIMRDLHEVPTSIIEELKAGQSPVVAPSLASQSATRPPPW